MYWLQPPPYARWASAALLVIGALWWDLRSPTQRPHPVAARQLDAGTHLTDGDIRWVDLPVGAFPIPESLDASLAVGLDPGEPLSDAVLANDPVVPDDWWAVSIELEAPAAPGDAVMLVVIDPPLTVPGVVIEPQRGDRVSLDHRPALVAVPGDAAAVVAAADSAGLLVAAVRPHAP